MGPANRPLALEWLEDFLLLAECGNFSRAAQARNIAQPAFSRHIKALEEWVGVALFDRSSHPVTLTAAGKRLQPDVAALLLSLESSRLATRAVHEQAQASLQFAATHALSLTFFPAWLSRIEARLPVGRTMGPIHMVSDSFAACEDVMLQGRAQFLLCHGHRLVGNRLDEGTYTFVKVGADRLIPVTAAASGEPLHAIDSTRSDVLPVLAYGEDSGLGQIMRSVMQSAHGGHRFNTVFTAHHAVLLKTMALEGRGIAWLPLSLITAELEAKTLRFAGDEAWSVPIEIRLFRPCAPLPESAEALWRVIVSAGEYATR